MTTTAIVIPEPNRVELREVRLTEPGPDDVVVRTLYTSISAGTERMLLAGRMPHPMLSLPVVPGYETVGRVVERGAGVPQEWDGRLVYVGGARCFADVNPAWGGQSATLIADHRRVVPLDGVDPEQGVLLSLAATALHGVDLLAGNLSTAESTEGAERRRASESDHSASSAPSAVNDLTGRRVLVLGQGPVGQLAARLVRARGAWVAVVDRVESRLERAIADLKLRAGDDPLPAQLGAPVHAIVEATGLMAALEGALPALAGEGTIGLLGYYEELRLPYMPLFIKQARLLAAREWAPGDTARCRDMLADGSLDVTGLITHRVPAAEARQAYRIALDEPECLKLVLNWDG